MQKKIKVGVLGCTGAVGQKLIALLGSHPFFELSAITASEKSAGKIYSECVNWRESSAIPDNAKNLVIQGCHEKVEARILFSGLDSKVAFSVEENYAKQGYVVVSNSKNHRMSADVPLVIPEINAAHLQLVLKQQSKYKTSGYIVTNPNCSITVAAIALFPIYKNFGLESVFISTMQAISGAGYPGIPSLDILGNVIPHIPEEEEKMESEILKIYGEYLNNEIRFANFKISAMCNRVPVRNGHTMGISFTTLKKAGEDEILDVIAKHEQLGLPSSPQKVLQYFSSPFRPQPLLDIDAGLGMTVSVGNLRKCSVLDWKFSALGHNTIRGAAGAAILNAEYLLQNGFIF